MALAPAPTTPSFLRPPPIPHHRVRGLPAPPPSASFRLSEILGGRGLCNGEVGIRKELASSIPPPSPSTPMGESSPGSAGEKAEPGPALDPDAFEKEMMGLTGGFPGGEVGLKDFVAKNTPHSPKPTGTSSTAVDELEAREKGPSMVNPRSVVLEPPVEDMKEDDQREGTAATKS